jgi:hypothetical protein
MIFFKIGSADFSGLVSGLKVGYETLVSNSSGRNANGDTVLDIINTKRKIYVTLKHTFADDMRRFLAAIKDYQVEITYLDPRDNTLQTASVYTGTPEPEYYCINKYDANKSIYKPMSLNFIEL